MLTDVLKKRLAAGDVLYGPFIDSCSEDLIEIVALAGFDYALIDAEHSPCDPMIALRLLRAAAARRLPCIIRVNNLLPGTILKMMDIGSGGIMAPLVHDEKMADDVAQAVRYYPHGRRGTALMRASDYACLSVEQHFAKTNTEAFVMVQAESVQAIENLEKIVQVKEVDAVFIGPYDLSQSMGIPGQVEGEQIQKVITRAVRIIRDSGKAAGIIAGTPERTKMLTDLGFNLIAYSTDLDIFRAACQKIVASLKGK